MWVSRFALQSWMSNFVYPKRNGMISTVLVNITYCQNCFALNVTPVPQAMTFNGTEYIDNTMSLIHGNINFTITVSDTAGNTFTSPVQTGIVPDHPPTVSNLQFIDTQFSQFILETENITISYIFHDPDVADKNHSTIQWYLNGFYLAQYDNVTFIPATDLLVGEVWYFIVIPSDGYIEGSPVQSASMTIESVPHIHNSGVTAINDTEGHYIFWFNVTAHPVHPLNPNSDSPIISFELLVNNTISLTSTPLYANYNGSLFTYNFLLNDYSLLVSLVTVSISATSAVKYSGITSLITSSANFNFIMLDTAPPKVLNVIYSFNNLAHPTTITFYAQIIDYGSGVANATLYYYFVPASSNLSSSQLGNQIFIRNKLYTGGGNEFQAVVLQKLNSTYYSFTVDFNSTVDTFVLFRIAVSDKAGNNNPNAYPLGLDTNRPGAEWLVPTSSITLEQIIEYLVVIISFFAVF